LVGIRRHGVAQRRVGGLRALDVTRQRLRVVPRGEEDAGGDLIALQFALALERQKRDGYRERVALPDGVAVPAAHIDERNGGLVEHLSASHLPRLLPGGNVRDSVGQHAGEFVLIGGRQNQAGWNEYGPARKRRGLVNPGLAVVHQFERIAEARGRRLGGESLPEVIEADVDRRGVDRLELPAILRGELRAKRFFLFDAVEVDAAARGGDADRGRDRG